MLPFLFPETSPSSRTTTWRYLWPVLLAGFVLRLVLGTVYPFMTHPDEVFQYTEQAHRLVYGYGVVPWEYVYGVRSWIIPFGLAGLLEAGRSVGLDRPEEYIPLITVALSAVSLSLPLGIYRLSQHLMDERGAVLALLFGVFWWHFLHFAPRPMPGILATYALVWFCVLLYRRPSATNLILLGLLGGSVLVLRFQLLPVVGILGLFVLLRLGFRTWPAIVSFGSVVAFAGLVDLWTWGSFLFSFFENFRLNFSHDLASTFGVSGLGYYAFHVGRETGGLVVPALAGTILIYRKFWPVLAAVIVGVAALHIPGHKELRFVLWSFPFTFIGLAAGLTFVSGRLRGRLHPIVLHLGIIAFCFVVSAISIYMRDPWASRELPLRSTFLAISRETDVTGIELLTPTVPWYRTYGYAALGHPVPVYFWGWHNDAGEQEIATRRAHVSHVVTGPGIAPPPGYEPAFEIGGYRTWVASGPRAEAVFTEFDLRVPFPTDRLDRVAPNARAFRLETGTNSVPGAHTQ